ncbi:hypothetical protein [Polaribacter tangerinus]
MKSTKTTENSETDFSGNANEFINKVKENPLLWTNKIIVVEGNVTHANNKSLTLNNLIFCQYEKSEKTVPLNKIIKIKGRFIGYDDLMAEVKLDKCIFQN